MAAGIDFSCDCDCGSADDTTLVCSGTSYRVPGVMKVTFAGLGPYCVWPNSGGNIVYNYPSVVGQTCPDIPCPFIASAPLANSTYRLSRYYTSPDNCLWCFRNGTLRECDILTVHGITVPAGCCDAAPPSDGGSGDRRYQYVGQRTCTYPYDDGAGGTCTATYTVDAYLSLRFCMGAGDAGSGVLESYWCYVISVAGLPNPTVCTGTSGPTMVIGAGILYWPGALNHWYENGCIRPFAGDDQYCAGWSAPDVLEGFAQSITYPYAGSNAATAAGTPASRQPR
jgi:hypothetical protein